MSQDQHSKFTDSKFCATQAFTSKAGEDGNQPAWAPLRDSYMLTNSKLKDWDKMAVRCPIFILLSVLLKFFGRFVTRTIQVSYIQFQVSSALVHN